MGLSDYAALSYVGPSFYLNQPQQYTHDQALAAYGGTYRDFLVAAMPPGERNPFSRISDGLSNTILLAEDAGRPAHWVLGKQIKDVTTADWGWADPNMVFSIDGSDPRTGAIGKSQQAPVAHQPWRGAPKMMARGATSTTTLKPMPKGGTPSCTMNCNNDGEFYSFHSGGIQVVLCDGSVHFLTKGISPAVIAALVTRAGEELPGGW